jgi:hypothetical protein
MSLTSMAGDLSGLASRAGNIAGTVNSIGNIISSFAPPASDSSIKAISISSLKDSIRAASRQNLFGVMIITDMAAAQAGDSGSVAILDYNITMTTIPGIQYSKMTFYDQGRQYHFSGSSSTVNNWEVTFRVNNYVDYEIIRKWHEIANNPNTGNRGTNKYYKTECVVTPWYPNTGQEDGDKVKIDKIVAIKLMGVFPLVISDIQYDVTNSELATFNVSFSIDSIEFGERGKFLPGSYAVANINSNNAGSGILDVITSGVNEISQISQGIQTIGGFF